MTILQSQFSLDKHAELGLELRNPVVVHNSVDPAIFHPPRERQPHARLRVISTSWSGNPRKGGDILSWLDRNLDFDDVDMTFAGNTLKRSLRATPRAPGWSGCGRKRSPLAPAA